MEKFSQLADENGHVLLPGHHIINKYTDLSNLGNYKKKYLLLDAIEKK